MYNNILQYSIIFYIYVKNYQNPKFNCHKSIRYLEVFLYKRSENVPRPHKNLFGDVTDINELPVRT